MRNARIMRVVVGKEHTAHVEDIEVGKLTGERVYRLKYSEGDMQHMTEQQVREHRAPYEKAQERRAIGAFYLEVLRVVQEGIGAMGDQETTAADFYDEVMKAHPQLEGRALELPLVVQQAFKKAIQDAKSLGEIWITAVSKQEGPVFRRAVRAR